METEDYFTMVTREFGRMKKLADDAMNQLADESFFAAPADGDNSIAVLVKHVSGNMLSRWTDFITADGEKTGRSRDAEFVILADDSRERLVAQWQQGWQTLFDALAPLRSSDLERNVMIRGEALTVMQALNRQLTHYAYHIGQIVYLAKHFQGPRWKTLSIPVGKSEEFNRAARKYLEKP
jgi:hypothetical protein